MEPPPTDPLPDPRAAESATARAEDSHAEPVLGYAARPTGSRGLWRWIRPGSVLFFVMIAGLAAGAGWGAWKWRLAADRKAFEACATTGSNPGGTTVTFIHSPSRGALRSLARLTGLVSVYMEWPEGENAAAAQAFGAADLGNVSWITMRDKMGADLLLRQLARPDSGLKALSTLHLDGTNVTDVGLKELTRPDSGFKALSELYLDGTNVTDAGLKELTRPDCGLKALILLNLVRTNITDAGLKELARSDSGLKALSELYLDGKNVTDAGLKELARPESGLKALTTLDLRGTKITDAGLKELIRPDSGLKALTTLDLIGTEATEAGVKALQAARPGLTIVR